MTNGIADPWVAYHHPRPAARLRLFCFPYAGGGASIYRPWGREMPPEIEVCPIQLPGREQRLRDKPFTRAAALVEALATALPPLLDERPFAFFGYSMGAIIAYELTHRLPPERRPRHLLVSARRAPQIPSDEETTYDLPKDAFRAKLRSMGGTPQDVLDHEELMSLVEPILRSDFELVDTYGPSSLPPLDLPITAFGGEKDLEVSREDMEAWRQATTGPFRLQMFSGDHFYIHNQRESLIREVSRSLFP